MRIKTMIMTVAGTGLLLAGCGAPADPAADNPSMTEEPMTDEAMTDEASKMADDDMAEKDKSKDDMSKDDKKMKDVADIYHFSATTLDGEDFDGATLAGSPTVLWFWAPWCPTCQAQIPNMTALGKKYQGEVNVVGVGGLDTGKAISELAKEEIPNVQHLVDEKGSVWKHFGISEQSTFVVLDPTGKIIKEGALSDEELNSTVAKLADK